MAFIYCITNIVNNKKYVGKTTLSIQKRFYEHCRDSQKEHCNKRPLYIAMNKHGIKNFKITCLEEIKDENVLSEREIFWIQQLHSYGNSGYNATKGGDGAVLYDHSEIITLYKLGYSFKTISEKLGCDRTTISNIIKVNNLPIRYGSNMVVQYDLLGNQIRSFNSIMEATQWLLTNKITSNKHANNKIVDCCKGKIKKAYGYIWKYPSSTLENGRVWQIII